LFQAEKELERFRREKEEELKERDAKIEKMKKQMADAFTGNSW